MTKTHLSLTKAQVKTLMELVYLGNWMANAHRTDPIRKYDDLAALVYAAGVDAGLEDLVEYDGELKRCFPLARFEEGELRDLKDDYDDETFWTELVERLTERDLLRQYGEEGWERLSRDERDRARDELESWYSKEAATFGIDRLECRTRSPQVSPEGL